MGFYGKSIIPPGSTLYQYKVWAQGKTGVLAAGKGVENLIKQSPNIGFIDPLFSERPQTYRSFIVNNLNKMVYREDGDVIYIVAFWDTRMEPEQQASKVK